MALTKVTGQVVSNTTDVTVGVLTVSGISTFTGRVAIGTDLRVEGSVSVGGTITYEDVTNVNSVGNITVGSGITLSKDGDGFFTGVVTATSYAGDGSGLTGIAATDNVRTGILDVAGVGTFRNDVNIPDKIIHLGDTDTAIRFPAADTVSVETGGSERARFDSNGRLLVGQTSSVNGVYGSPPPRFSVSTTTASPAIFATYSNDVYGSRIDLIKSRSTTVGGTTVVQAGDAIGEIVFGGADGDQFHPTAIIQSAVESGVGNNDMPGDLRFYTNGGATTGTERMRINSAGIITKPYTPSFSAKGSTDAIVAQSPLPFDSTGGINHNNGNHYSTTTYKFTCPVDGYYYVTCHVVPTDFSTGNNVELYVKDNSGNRHFLDRKVKTSNYTSNNFSVGGSRIIYQTATSTLWVEFNGIAGSPTLEGSSHFGITLIG